MKILYILITYLLKKRNAKTVTKRFIALQKNALCNSFIRLVTLLLLHQAFFAKDLATRHTAKQLNKNHFLVTVTPLQANTLQILAYSLINLFFVTLVTLQKGYL